MSLKEEERTQKHSEEENVRTEAEIGMTYLQGKEHQELCSPEAGRGTWDSFFLRASLQKEPPLLTL